LLAIPYAEVNIERLFSKGRDILGIRRIALGANTMRIVRLIKSYFNEIDRGKKAITLAKQAKHMAQYRVSANTLILEESYTNISNYSLRGLQRYQIVRIRLSDAWVGMPSFRRKISMKQALLCPLNR
jgi:hypothetical protein